MKLSVIITGATGMVGEGVLMETLNYPDVEKVLIVNRRPSGFSHPKLKEIIHNDFLNIKPIEQQLTGYNACFFCLGMSSVGVSKDKYYSTTYTLTMHVAEILASLNPDMTFCYISGAGTDSTGKSMLNWARVKGKTEDDLMRLPFRKVYNFRPGFLIPSAELKNTHGYYKTFKPLYPLFRAIFPGMSSTLSELGRAMINSVLKGYEKSTLEVKDIIKLSNK
jgi:uncharacterized protein YbjT (DUF2867 family)